MPGKYQSEEHSRRTAQLISVTRCAYAFPCTNTFISIFSFSLRRDTTVALKKNKPTIKMRLMEQLKARPLQRIQRVATHVDDGAVTWIFTCEISTRADTIHSWHCRRPNDARAFVRWSRLFRLGYECRICCHRGIPYLDLTLGAAHCFQMSQIGTFV